MSLRNQVIWRDGLFIKPHHFQQQQRYLENYVRSRTETIEPYWSGFSALEISQEGLLHSKIALESATGVMPDGSIFDLSREEPIPEPLDVSEINTVNQLVYLALPLRANGVPEIFEDGVTQPNIRMQPFSQEVRDNASAETEPYFVDVAQYEFRIMLADDDLSSYSVLPIARILEKRSDGSLILDPEFMPCSTSIAAIKELGRHLDDFTGLLQQRARQIAERIGSPGQRGVPEVAEFMLLQTVNRLSQKFRHFASLQGLHPKDVYEMFAESAGELATFTHEARMPDAFPAYYHAEPQISFKPLIASLRKSLGAMIEPNAVALPLEEHKFGIRISNLNELELIKNCIFVVAVKAAISLEKLARDFPAQVKVSSKENIRDLIKLHLPGIVLQPLPSAPRQLPYHAGFTYFQLDANSSGWKVMKTATGFAFHIAGEFPDLEMQFWAIRT